MLGPQYGCTSQQGAADLKDFVLGLPPGFLGNPTATPLCPQAQLEATSCPHDDVLGSAVIHNLVAKTSPTDLSTHLFNAETVGAEPARLGTEVFPSNPAGPFPITVAVRTTGDYGIDSTNTDTPRNLGGPPGLNAQIDTVLCATVPCELANPGDVWSPLSYSPGARPFFRNPTSCGTKTVTLDATSWKADPVVAPCRGDLRREWLRERAVRPRR